MRQLIVKLEKYESKFILIENEEVVEIFIENENLKSIEGNIYKGKVTDIIEGISTVFVDIGQDRKGFLNLDLLKNKNKIYKNAEIIVEVDKIERDEKGAKLNLDYSIKGKNLVLLPNSKKISISNKIRNREERERLKSIFEAKIDKGLIIRTSAEFLEKEILEKEYKLLILKYKQIEKNFKNLSSGDILYKNKDMLEFIMREIIFNFEKKIDEIIVDNEKNLERIKLAINKFSKDNLLDKREILEKLKKYTKEEEILRYYKIDFAIEKALRNKIWLDCGGYIVIEKTEALISIDVNSGQNQGRNNFEEAIFQTNVEAAEEIAKQLKLRNLGGIIIIDFIDMRFHENRRKVLEVLEENLKRDRRKTEIVHFSKLGLVEMTRKREGKELASFFKEKCCFCLGSGSIISEERTILNILEELKDLSLEKDIKLVEIISEENIIKKLKRDFISYLESILKNKKIKFELSENWRKNTNLEKYKINLYK